MQMQKELKSGWFEKHVCKVRCVPESLYLIIISQYWQNLQRRPATALQYVGKI